MGVGEVVGMGMVVEEVVGMDMAGAMEEVDMEDGEKVAHAVSVDDDTTDVDDIYDDESPNH